MKVCQSLWIKIVLWGIITVLCAGCDRKQEWKALGKTGFSEGIAWYNALRLDDSGNLWAAFKDKYAPEGCVPNPAAGHCGLGEPTVMRFVQNKWENVGTPRFAGPVSFVDLAFFQGEPWIGFMDTQKGKSLGLMHDKGQGWQGVIVEPSGRGAVYFVNLVPRGKELWAAFSQEGDGQWIHPRVLKFDGAGWSPVGRTQISSQSAYYLNLIFFQGVPYLAYKDEALKGHISVKSFDGKEWRSERAEGVSDGEADFVTLAEDGNALYAAYVDVKRDNRVSVLRYERGKWGFLGKPGFSPGQANEMAIKARNGAVYVAFIDQARQGKVSVMTYVDGEWAYLGEPGFSGSYGKYLAMELGEGKLYVGYSDFLENGRLTVKSYDLEKQ